MRLQTIELIRRYTEDSIDQRLYLYSIKILLQNVVLNFIKLVGRTEIKRNFTCVSKLSISPKKNTPLWEQANLRKIEKTRLLLLLLYNVIYYSDINKRINVTLIKNEYRKN